VLAAINRSRPVHSRVLTALNRATPVSINPSINLEDNPSAANTPVNPQLNSSFDENIRVTRSISSLDKRPEGHYNLQPPARPVVNPRVNPEVNTLLNVQGNNPQLPVNPQDNILVRTSTNNMPVIMPRPSVNPQVITPNPLKLPPIVNVPTIDNPRI